MKSLRKYIENKMKLHDEDYMQLAIDMAMQARSSGDVPVAAVLVLGNGKHLVEHDTRYTDSNPLNYAIINVLNKAADTLSRNRLSDAVLYCTVEPNLMCISAIQAAGIKEVVFGVYDDKDGFISSRMLADHTLLDVTAVGGTLGKECYMLLPESMHEHVRYNENE